MTSTRKTIKDSPESSPQTGATTDIISALNQPENIQSPIPRRRSSILNEQNNAWRRPPPKKAPLPPPSSQKLTGQKIAKEIHASIKHRWKGRLNFFMTDSQSHSESNKSFHLVQGASYKGELYFFKHNTPSNPLMSELEAAAWSCYHLIEPKQVPEKVFANFDEKGNYVGVSLKGIKDFVPVIKQRLQEKDLQNSEIVKGIAIGLILSYFFEEDDLHRGNISKSGIRIDFDMSLWPVIGQFKKGAMIDLVYRRPDPERFIITPADIDSFPVLHNAEPFYWPTKPVPIITQNQHKIINRFKTISNNAFPEDQNDNFAQLKDNPIFLYYKFKTLLKCALMSKERFRFEIYKHIRSELTCEMDGKQQAIAEVMVDHIAERQEMLRNTLVKMESFRKFLCKDGEKAIKEITEEFSAQNTQTIKADVKRERRHPDSGPERMIHDLIDTKAIQDKYDEIFSQSRDNWFEQVELATQKLR